MYVEVNSIPDYFVYTETKNIEDRTPAHHALQPHQLGAPGQQPAGFTMERFEIVENRDLRVIAR